MLTTLRQRVYGIMASYEGCNDHDALRDEAMFLGRAPRSIDLDPPPASQRTLTRFEGAVPIRSLHKLLGFPLDTAVERPREHNGGAPSASVTLNLDATDDPTDGHQQLSLPRGYFARPSCRASCALLSPSPSEPA